MDLFSNVRSFLWEGRILASGIALLVTSAGGHAGMDATAPPTIRDAQKVSGGTFFGSVPDEKLTRHYYIAAEPATWNYLPLRRDPTCSITGVVQQMSIPRALLENPASPKLRYFQYTDDRFALRVAQPERLGILGPVLRGTVGQYLAVTFFNRTDRPLSMHPHGVKCDKENEGAAYLPAAGPGSAVPPSGQFTYVWKLDESSGPGPGEPSSKAWLYHSHVATEEEINLGLVGSIIVTDPKCARADGTPKDVDREMEVFLKIFDEGFGFQNDEGENSTPPGGALPLEERVLRLAKSVRALRVQEQNERHTINGLSFANLSGLEMRENERVRWYLLALGSERDMHSAHWHGNRVIGNGMRTDVVELMPGSMKIADMIADNPGTWLLQCHVGEHMSHGMFCTYQVLPSNSVVNSAPFPGVGSDSLRISVGPGDADFSQNQKLHLNMSFTLWSVPRIENASVVVQYDGSSDSFQLDANGRAEKNGQHLAMRILRSGNGMLGVDVGAELELAVHRDREQGVVRQLKILFNGELLSGEIPELQ